MMYTSPKFESEGAARKQVECLQKQPRLTVRHEREKETVHEKCVATNFLTYMGCVSEIVLKTMIKGFATVSFIEIEIEKNVLTIKSRIAVKCYP